MTKDNQLKEEDIIKSSEQIISEDKELRIVRTFDAPKELLYKAFIEPSYLAQWWGNYYCEKTVCNLNPKVGGSISIQMTMKGGIIVDLKGEFHELIENEKLVFTTGTLGDSKKEKF